VHKVTRFAERLTAHGFNHPVHLYRWGHSLDASPLASVRAGSPNHIRPHLCSNSSLVDKDPDCVRNGSPGLQAEKIHQRMSIRAIVK